MRIGVLGGSFDPVHFGHLLMAECCREQCRLDVVRFVPTAISPHKLGSQPASGVSRVEMLRLAIGGHSSFEVSTCELERGGVSYSVDTLQRISDQSPQSELFLIMGGDTLVEFPLWREPQRICELVTLIVVGRPGSPPPDFHALANLVSPQRVVEIRAHHVLMPQIDISSTEIRQRVAEGRSIRFQLPRSVEKYIEAQELYRG